jgi:hypothetical protein
MLIFMHKIGLTAIALSAFLVQIASPWRASALGIIGLEEFDADLYQRLSKGF